MKATNIAGAICLSLIAFWAWSIYQAGVEKEEWATLQSVEDSYRSATQQTDPVVLPDALGTQYDLVGFSSHGMKKYPYVWIMLNPSEWWSSEVKLMPDHVEFSVKCSDIGNLQSKYQINFVVKNFLSKRCIGKP